MTYESESKFEEYIRHLIQEHVTIQKLPSITTIAKLAQALELSLSELMGFVDKEMKK